MVKKIVLVQRYSAECKTPEQIKAFNDFYDLEEARMNHERQICIDYNIEVFMSEVF